MLLAPLYDAAMRQPRLYALYASERLMPLPYDYFHARPRHTPIIAYATLLQPNARCHAAPCLLPGAAAHAPRCRTLSAYAAAAAACRRYYQMPPLLDMIADIEQQLLPRLFTLPCCYSAPLPLR